MALDLTPEQRQLRDSVRGYLSRRSGDDESWHGLIALGATEMPFPEPFGGAGCSVADTAVVAYELGRTLAAVPYFSSICLAGLVLSHSASDAGRTDHLPAIASGDRTAALVTGYPFTDTAITGGRSADRVLLTGTQDFVVDGATADTLVVVVRVGDAPQLAVIDAASPGVTTTPLPSLDSSRPLGRVEFRAATAQLVSGPDPVAGLRRAQACALALLAAEQVGAAERCLEMSVDHARTREQFGRPIGSFQSIKHRLADMLVAIELARAAVLDAVREEDRDLDDLTEAVSIARVLASRAFTFAAEESIQVHGGIGFTWEHPLHRYFRRAKADELLFGTVEHHLEVVATAALSPA
ncbi:acyl-CoA dehydrogenase family protein [Rhodococcus gannanensis]|uniref:Acyl-CoA dehydrogenase family protein n=1 Tax=Rhodococcus gannanensis TaxID=1960308 RepID=A0ABW4NYW1_9NOCA